MDISDIEAGMGAILMVMLQFVVKLFIIGLPSPLKFVVLSSPFGTKTLERL
jgi:hypothetical protein